MILFPNLWPFNPPAPNPDALLSRAGEALQAIYWAGVRDGVVAASIVAILLILFVFHKHLDQ